MKDKRPIIIAIDDNEAITSYIHDCLSDKYSVFCASNGIQGLLLILKLIPDLVICDIMMPFSDGFEVCGKTKRDLRTSHIPVMLLTARDSDEDKTRGYRCGADSYITKPFSTELLRSRVDNLIESRRKMARELSKGALGSADKSADTQELNPMDNEFIVRITDLIINGINSRSLDVNTLAEQMCMSQSTLYRKIKGLLAMSTNEYIRNVRIHEAAKLLRSGTHNVQEAAWQVDINNLAYFRNCFKEEFGMSPSEYRKRHAGTK